MNYILNELSKYIKCFSRFELINKSPFTIRLNMFLQGNCTV